MGTERPAKRVKLLSDDETSSGSESEASGGVPVALGFNEEYARRFEHNKKRAELHRLEEKYGKDGGEDGDSDESTDEEEDEDADLANGALDDEFQAALRALKNKDPVIYDTQHKFYSTDPDAEPGAQAAKQDKPLHLVDYQRQRLLNGDVGGDEEAPTVQHTYADEQEALRKSFIRGAEAANGDDAESEDGSEEEENNDFLTRKNKIEPQDGAKGDILTEEIRTKAADDPDRFLSSFMANKGWVSNAGSKLQAFESDDEDFDDIQDEFEHKYNMRFENQDTKGKIQTFARDIASQHSVRKEPLTQRQRMRETERQQKEEEKQQRAQEKARLRKLKLDEAEEKLRMVKKAAGTQGKDFDMEQWANLLTRDYDDKWQQKFEENFGDNYYAEQDYISDDGDDGDDDGTTEKKKKPKKPKFDDDIDITDLVPDFDEEQTFSITEDEDENGVDDKPASKKKKSSKDIKKAREEAKRDARKERRKLEALVDEQLEMDSALGKAGRSKTGATPFRYRETSPTSFGLTPSEILMASDTQLNQFVGIKKLASFRDDTKKRKDRKHLGKKARLRKWRQETFGNESGPTKTIQDVMKESEE